MHSPANTKGTLSGCPLYLRSLLKYLFLLFEEFFDLVVCDDALFEHVCSGFLRLDHLDALRKVLTRAGFQCCDYFLCHKA